MAFRSLKGINKHDTSDLTAVFFSVGSFEFMSYVFFFRKSVGKKFCKRQIYPNTLKTLEIFADGRSRFLYITHHYPNLGCGFNGFFGTFATKIASVNFPN